jgi:hypothetical protein
LQALQQRNSNLPTPPEDQRPGHVSGCLLSQPAVSRATTHNR